jgi:hypothetical protein
MNLIETIKPFLERICEIIKIFFANNYNNVLILTKYLNVLLVKAFAYFNHAKKIGKSKTFFN